MPRAKSNVTSIFSGYPTDAIMQWCGVSRVTACLWKRGERMPSRRAVRLFLLNAHGQVIPAPWKGWFFHPKTGELVSPEGWAFSPGRILAYELLNRNGIFRDGYEHLPAAFLESLRA
jgi:hypothetical protein